VRQALLNIEVVGEGPELALRLDGELDMSSIGTLRGCLESIDGGCRRVVLDLSLLRFLDAAGIGLVLEMHRRFEADGRELELRGPRGEVQRVIEMSGLVAEVRVEQAEVLP
jgi:serine/threonine-protein kinase RsbW